MKRGIWRCCSEAAATSAFTSRPPVRLVLPRRTATIIIHRSFSVSVSRRRQVPPDQILEELEHLEAQVAKGQLDHLPLRNRQQVFRQIDDLHRQLQATEIREAHSGQYGGGPRRPEYPRSGRWERFQQTWRHSPGFRQFAYGCVAAACIFAWYNQELVPITNRRRFNCFPNKWEEALGELIYRETIEQFKGKLLPDSDPRTQMVRRVIQGLAPVSGLEDYEVHVIEDRDQRNAFAVPGGQVFVFSGLLPICKTEAGLAAVLSHELAHVVAHHWAERMSSTYLLFGFLIPSLAFWDGGLMSFWLLQQASSLVYNLPASRLEETEADQIGLILMARSCYDPSAAIGIWERMLQAGEMSPPEWLSTHPSTYNRIENIKGWLEMAERESEAAGCARVRDQAQAFADSFGFRPVITKRMRS